MLRNTLNTFITATLIMLLGVSSSAKAIVPAGNLMGTTSVTWGGETASEIQTSIQSILVPAPPILSGPADQTRIPTDKSSVTLEYTITSNANGEDKYALTLEIVSAGVEDAGVPVVVGVEGGMVTLGATAAMEAADAGATEIKVPSDGVSDEEVNGITNGDTVSINNKPYTVGEVVDDGNTAKIPLTPGLIGPVAFGDRIAQQETFEVSLDTVGTITEDAETGTVTITVTATSKSPGVPPADDDVVLTLQTPVGPSVEKYVRNVTPENDRNPPDNLEWVDQGFAYKYPPDSETFYFRSQLNDGLTRNDEALVKAEEDDTLEYLIVLKAGNQEDQTGIILNETLSPFTAYLPGYAKINNESIEDNDDGNSPVLTENWTVANAEGPLTIDTNGLAYITYQVTVGGEEVARRRRLRERGDIDLSTPEGIKLACNGDSPQLFSIETCKGQPWDARNGTTLEKNPVCWDRERYGGWQVDGKNPWVVGFAAEYNNAAYDCRTKCAGKSGESFAHCATADWWDNETAKSTACEWKGLRARVFVATQEVGDRSWSVRRRVVSYSKCEWIN